MKKFTLGLTMFALPLLASAQDVTSLIDKIQEWVSLLTPVVVGIALLAFFWGLAKFIFNSGNEEKKSEGKNIMIWGVIALFVMVSVWGIVGAIGDTLDIEQGGTIPVPSVE